MLPDCPVQFDGIDHVVIRVTNRDRTLHFYTQILGMTIERVIEDMNMYQVRCGRNLIDICVLPPGKKLAEKEERGLDHFCLNIRGDLDAIVSYLKEHNVEIVFGPIELYGATGYGTSIYILDPDSHTIELKANYSQYPIKTTVKEAKAATTRPTAKA
jgi:catechol 2,3-dioxygenase-like lactoylglutathione lyase family enzyme